MLQPAGFFDFAVYSDALEGPLTVSAHSIMLRPTSDDLWRFTMESFKEPYTFSLSNTGFDGMAFVARLMVVQSAGDWFSDMWAASGRAVPERWIARRFSASPDQSVRYVAEYREPWPACLDEEALRLGLLSGASYDSCLRPFMQRSEKAFSIERGAPETMLPPAGPVRLSIPPYAPDPTKLAGEVEQDDRGLRDQRRRRF
jgi:hypothetical protein